MQPRALNGLMRLAVVAAVFGSVVSPRALAQEKREPAGKPLPPYARVFDVPDEGPAGPRVASTNGLPNIMLTGYWPPTNDMLRRFSPNPRQNPEGWVGEDWEGRGYNIYAYFPEFPGGLGKGEGDLEVDYQDTSADFWPIAAATNPIAIMTFGLAEEDTDWELEWRQRNLGCGAGGWYGDYETPYLPTPCPPDESVPAGEIRYSSLPMEEMVAAVSTAGLGLNPFVDTTEFAGAFLCEFIAYHATWYHDLHADSGDPAWNVAAGHTHVGSLVGLPQAIQATKITLRVLLHHVDVERAGSGDIDGDGDVDLTDYAEFPTCFSGPGQAAGFVEPSPLCRAAFDFDEDTDVDLPDFGAFQIAFAAP